MEWVMKIEKGPCRVNHAAVAVDNFIFSFGGYVSGQDYNDDTYNIEVFRLNIKYSQWTELQLDAKNAPFRRYGHSVVAYGTKIYLWGGRNDETCDGTLYCFDTESLRWSIPSVSGDIPNASDGHASAIFGDTMYIHGGYVEQIGQFTLGLHALNLNSFVWVRMPSSGNFPLHRDFHSMSCTSSGHLVVFGGREMVQATYTGAESETYPSTVHLYHATQKTWTNLVCSGDIPMGRRSHSAFVYNNKLFVFGGFNSRQAMHMNDLHSFDLESLQWSRQTIAEVRPVARRRQALCLIGSLVYMFGGTHPDPRSSHVTSAMHYTDAESDEKLQELDDLWVLDLEPSLMSLCLVRVVRYNLPLHELPTTLQKRAKYVPRPDSRPVSLSVTPTRRS